MARTIVIAAATLLLGLFVGGLGPRAEVGRLKKELEETRAAASRGGSSAALPLALGMGSLMAAQERAREQGQLRQVPRFLVPDAGPASAEDSPESQRTGDGGADGGRRRRRFGFGDDKTFAAAKAAADMRAAQYRTAFLDEARLAPAQQMAFDESIKKMNDDLARAADELAESLATRTRKLGPRDIADVGARVLEIYRSADDRLKAGLDDAGRGALERTDFDILTQIDLGAFRKLGDRMEALGVSDLGRRR
jgi:hypothetical protein